MGGSEEQKYLEAQAASAQQVPVQQVPVQVPVQVVPVPTTQAPIPASTDTSSFKKRGLVESYILVLTLGWLGAHQFYLRRPGWGVLYLLTVGLFGVGWAVDIFRLPVLVKRANQAKASGNTQTETKTLDDAYILWLPMGFFGAHHFYLRQWGWAVTYLLTCGLFGMGWLMDLFCMHSMVRDFNAHNKEQKAYVDSLASNPTLVVAPPRPRRRLADAYRLCIFPVTGLLGCHHYYLGRIAFGLFYTFTLGGFGLGWFIDWFRLWALVADSNKRIKEGKGFAERRLDDCYIVAVPAGLFGAHHFYLRRVGWGFIYFFTVGCLGVGWLVDMVRMYHLVKAHKEEMAEARRRRLESGHVNPAVVSQDHLVAGPGADRQPRYVTVLSPGVHPPPGLNTLAEGNYIITPAPPYTAVPGVHPPNLPQIPPGYETGAGYSSWSTIESSEVDQPPSYENSINTHLQTHNQGNQTKHEK